MRTIYNTLRFILAICFMVALAAPGHAQNKPFQAIDIGVVGEVGGLSNDTPVKAVGQRNGRAFVFSEGQTTPRALEFVPGDPANTSSQATAISDDGAEAVGLDRSRPTDWPNPVGPSNPGHFPTPAGCVDLGIIVALNDNRLAAGSCSLFTDGFSQSRPLMYSAGAGQLTTAALPAGTFGGLALDLNNAGTIVGQVTNAQFTKLAAIWTNAAQAPLTFALPGVSEVRGISSGSILTGNPDLITVQSQFPDPIGVPHPRGWTMVFANGTIQLTGFARIPFTPIALPPSYPSYYQFLYQTFTAAETKRINRSGTTVGLVRRSNGTNAALWNIAGSVADLTFNTSGLPAGTVLAEAVDINDQGYVLAKGLVNGQLHGFMLKPTGTAIAFSQGY